VEKVQAGNDECVDKESGDAGCDLQVVDIAAPALSH